MKQPPRIERVRSGTSKSGWTFRYVPRPPQVTQALSGSLKEK
jgi:hypothetical protein